jgi:UPF0755 protein
MSDSTFSISDAKRRYWIGAFVIALFLGVMSFGIGSASKMLSAPPEAFPIGEDVTIKEGSKVADIVQNLEDKRLVRSSLYAYLVLTGYKWDTKVQAGTYRFPQPLSTEKVIESIVIGINRTPSLKVTFPEGFRAKDLYTYLPDSFATVTPDTFRYEGYLFPDTYFISPNTTMEEIIDMLIRTFQEKITPFEARIAQSGFTKEEVIILASIIEREAKNFESKRIVSGILSDRLAMGMPLQVDAAFDYVLGKDSAELTQEDLSIDSPYNTYRFAGLPPAPIANPGLESIEAVLSPIDTDYLYYLTDNEGNFHYAKTFDEHKQNKLRYLR